ncbi:SDR family oxidoreductase [Mycolicibacterium sp. CH28]|nr:SDR family oxidoreductase [Mycolicibacterium sp. CH28]
MDSNLHTSAVITGASRGIGLAIAKKLAGQGVALTISSRTAADLEALAPQLRSLGAPSVTPIAADMADPESLPAIIESHREANTDLSALIVNAGVGSAGTVGEYALRRLDKTMAINFRAPFQLIQSALPLLRAAAERHHEVGAKIVVLSSITGVYAEPALAAYGASKAALISLVEALNIEESAAGVCATAVAPGYVDTDMAAWVHDRIPPQSMIPADDVAAVVQTVLALSRRTTLGPIVMARAGSGGHCA